GPHEGRRRAVQRGADQGRVHIEHVIGEAIFDTSMTVMRLVGMQHHALAPAVGAHGAAVVEFLHAGQGHSDRVALMAVRVIGMATEAGRQPAEAGGGLVPPQECARFDHAQTFKNRRTGAPIIADMIYPTKTALVLRRDLLPWQIANVAAFLTGGLAGTYPELVGEPYRDGSGRFYTPLVGEPVFVYGGGDAEPARVPRRGLRRPPR